MTDNLTDDSFELEHQLLEGNSKTTLELVHQLVDELTHGKPTQDNHLYNKAEPDVTARLTRLAFCLSQLLLTETVPLSDQDFAVLINAAPAIAQCFFASGFGSAGFVVSHFLHELRKRLTSSDTLTQETKLIVTHLLLSYSLYVEEELQLAIYFKLAPAYSVPTFIGLLACPLVLTQAAYRRREALIDTAALLEDVACSELPLRLLSQAWLNASYCERPDKHKLRQQLNRLITNWLMQNNIASTKPSVPPKRKKPVFAIVLEHLSQEHPFFATLSALIHTLKQTHVVIGVADEGCVDDETLALFDTCITFHEETQYRRHSAQTIEFLLHRLSQAAPNQIFYPSLGHHGVAIALATQKLAPKQWLGFETFATAMMTTFDSIFVPSALCGPETQDLFSEPVKTCDANEHPLTTYRPSHELEPHVSDAPNCYHFAILNCAKTLTPSFLSVCHDIKAQSATPVHFHFFTQATGVTYHAIKQHIVTDLPCHVYPELAPADYFPTLKACDICLVPFSFGNQAVSLDAASLGLPCVNLLGDEPHARFDGVLMQQLGMPSWLNTDSTENYLKAVMRLIEDNTLRVSLSHDLAENTKKVLAQTDNAQISDKLFTSN